MCIDLERWGELDGVEAIVRQSEQKREDDLRELLAQVPVLDIKAEPEDAPAIR